MYCKIEMLNHTGGNHFVVCRLFSLSVLLYIYVCVCARARVRARARMRAWKKIVYSRILMNVDVIDCSFLSVF
jgi:hypothetical protein